MMAKQTPIARFKLHATRVDRIADVDRPAVPDAEIVLFKRQEEKPLTVIDFNAGFILKASEGAVEVLQDGFWETMGYDGDDTPVKDKVAQMDILFGDFKTAILNVAKLVKKSKQDVEEVKTPTDEIVSVFEQRLKANAISAMFSYFRYSISNTVVNYKRLENGNEAVSQIIDKFKETVVKLGTEIIGQNRVDDEKVEVNKVGRKISSARLKKLKDALEVLKTIVGEAEVSVEDVGKKYKEATDMELKELIEKVDTLATTVTGIGDKQESLNKSLLDQGILKSENDLEKIKADKIIADKKIADDKIVADKKIADDKVIADKAIADKKAADDKVIADKVEAEKKVTDDAEARIVKMETAIETIAKKFGVKTSLDTDGKPIEKSGDPFGDAVKGIKRGEK